MATDGRLQFLGLALERAVTVDTDEISADELYKIINKMECK